MRSRKWRRGDVQVRAGLAVVAGLLDQSAREQGADDAVDVDPAHGADPAARDRLPVGDDRERLERGLGETGLLAVEHEALDERRALGARVVPPAAGDLTQVEAALVARCTRPTGPAASPRPRRPAAAPPTRDPCTVIGSSASRSSASRAAEIDGAPRPSRRRRVLVVDGARRRRRRSVTSAASSTTSTSSVIGSLVSVCSLIGVLSLVLQPARRPARCRSRRGSPRRGRPRARRRTRRSPRSRRRRSRSSGSSGRPAA